MRSEKKWDCRFKHPPREFYPVPFWFWNYRMETDEIRRQIKDMADIYINGVHVRFLPWPPFKVDISKFVHEGRNKITIKATNTLYNLLQGKSKASGLLGPVELVVLQ